ncbi:unnamed protein product [Rangifer tarandus platyrhynchus]|uniref:Uncharacterized protein n=2 Tax=Rangifer tarandus platyrhynchus TaxID=3082113 RepID=A0ABN8YAG8_RANTA|nr:unnamed protein product [Rangifer tarandus platyrhynchus]CAI9694952.1 unnamed protein product [Rangifer tarandus platyrhynchus]
MAAASPSQITHFAPRELVFRAWGKATPATCRPEPRASGAPPLALCRPSEAQASCESQRPGARPAPGPVARAAAAREPGNRPVRPPFPSAGRWGGAGPQAGRHRGGIVGHPPRAAAWRGPEPVSSHVTLLREAPPSLRPLGPPPFPAPPPPPASSYRLW